MRLAVASCWAYRDAWKPFFALLDKFWPNHVMPTLITDHYREDILTRDRVHIFEGGELTWCQLVAEYANASLEPLLLFQEDFFLTEPVNENLIFRGLDELIKYKAGCVRLYPCPGGDHDYGNPYYAVVDQYAQYRISCQVAIWQSEFLSRIARASKEGPSEFEIIGTISAWDQSDIILALKRDVQPWPMQYICSGISRGLWNPDSKKLCDQYGIANDWSMRAFAS